MSYTSHLKKLKKYASYNFINKNWIKIANNNYTAEHIWLKYVLCNVETAFCELKKNSNFGYDINYVWEEFK